MSRPVSIRFDEEVLERLRARSARRGESTSALAQRYVDEGLRMEGHPGIVFRDGPAGRRAGVVGGPDVWEIVGLVRDLDVRGDAAVTAAAEWTGMPETHVRTAINYWAEFPDEIDAWIDAAETDSRHAEEAWQAQQRLLA